MEEFSNLLLSLYRASRELPPEEFQEAALGLIKAVLPFDSSRWCTARLTFEGIVFNSIHTYEEPVEIIQDYQEVKEEDPIGIAAALGKGRTINANAAEVMKGKERSAFMDYLRRYRHQNMLVTALPNQQSEQTGLMDALSLYRFDPDHHYSERDRQLCQLLVPHLTEALVTNRVLHLKEMSVASDGGSHPTAIADGKGILYHVMPGFSALLREEWQEWGGMHLPPALHQATITERRVYKGKKIMVASALIHDLLFLKVRRRLPVDDLSAREIEVAKCIADGLTYKEIAQKLNIAPATVRNHIQRIHDRVGAHTNAELVAQLKMVVAC